MARSARADAIVRQVTPTPARFPASAFPHTSDGRCYHRLFHVTMVSEFRVTGDRIQQ